MMKINLLLSVLAISGLLNVGIAASRADKKAKPQVRFYCGQSFDPASQKMLPTTYLATSAKPEPVAIVRWKSNLGAYNPQVRCNMVSQKFQAAWNKDRLRYLKAGSSAQTGQGIICGLSTLEQSCDESTMLFTLKSDRDANDIIAGIEQIRRGKVSNPTYQSSGDGAIDLDELSK